MYTTDATNRHDHNVTMAVDQDCLMSLPLENALMSVLVQFYELYLS
jgi:hypothetical protein